VPNFDVAGIIAAHGRATKISPSGLDSVRRGDRPSTYFCSRTYTYTKPQQIGFGTNFAIVALTAPFIFVCIYNKTKTGMWLPGAKKNEKKNVD
jgi:hypothetical protein